MAESATAWRSAIPLLFLPTIYPIIEERGQHEKVKVDEPIAEGLPKPLQPLGAN